MAIDHIVLPSTVVFEPGAEPHSATLVMEPCFQGYGTTIGNAMRRVLLSSLPGAAITAFKISGATHEFTSIENVLEDVVEIALNLKQVRMRVHSDQPVRLTLSKKGEGVVTAGDFDANADVEMVNPKQPIATVTDAKGLFEIEVIVEKGRGFIPTEDREDEESEMGLIKIDAMFSPVRSVAFRVEPVRIGDITNFDKLIMDIETDGTLSPEEAVAQSASVLIQHIALLGGPSPSDTE
ncbi:DNA-directed RNA polymerase subunit alpha [Candidatus Uhrbacteria bacterium RIFCSPHIGHO2_02_FULL_53_13]|uniref:DNA-directed RNA polymerase subunit alpha n=2 Tax=Candidatus Uhriibacteriota TaxID=1752732 RepID=A0A1F7U0A6_9BACT|nr:MAG: DNA-directed RNA polymerase subunit alpha [Candidatus Uhrbacteria bacterium RIFCSPHIGHO2_02_FULL_53_13]OGL89175.1 MAG: DNA-directed RNA polymerase subunit alpha [Candidatus Uhrbacteria bacterium RIFCSPLOWO2_02_FULL_53_10]